MEMMQQITVGHHPHPIFPTDGREFKSHQYRHGQSVREVLIEHGYDRHREIVISLNDRLLTVEEWDTVSPAAGDIVNVHAVVSTGGGGGSNPLRILASLAVMYFAPQLGAMMPGATEAVGFGTDLVMGQVYGGLISMAGNALLGAIFSPPSAKLRSASMTGEAASPTYSLNGGSNAARRYLPMPILFGTHRIYPDYGAIPYVEFHGQDQYLYQIFNFGLSALTFDITQWNIGTTPLSSYNGVTTFWSDGSGALTQFPGNVDTIAGGDLAGPNNAYKTQYIQRTTSVNTIKIGVDVEGTVYFSGDQGLGQCSATIEAWYAVAGSGAWVPFPLDGGGATRYIDHGRSQTEIRMTLFVDVPQGQYDVRVRLVSATQDTGKGPHEIIDFTRGGVRYLFSQLRSYQPDTATYPGQTRLGMIIKASGQINGTVQQLSAVASASCYVWNGSTFVWQTTSNPAWWFLDFARGRYNSAGTLMYGVGLPDSQIDIEGIKAWATFCDSEGMSINGVIDSNTTCADVLTLITRCGIASVSWASGKLGVIWDVKNASAVAAFGMSNIIRGSFVVEYINENLADEIIVNYIDASNSYAPAQVRVLTPGTTTPTKPSTVDLFGCTYTPMAGKFANVLAAQQYYRRRRITWECDFEGFVCQRGDVVLLSHDLTQWGYSGRAVSIVGNVITLDRTVTLNGAVEYLMIKNPDGTMTTYNVTAGTGDVSTLTLSGSPTLQSGYAAVDHIWFFSPLATPGKKVKIVSVQPVSESRIRLIATDEDPAFYSAWSGTFITPGNSTQLTNMTPAITSVVYSEIMTLVGANQVGTDVMVNFSTGPNIEKINVNYRINGGAWTAVETRSRSIVISTALSGYLEVQATPVYFELTGQTFNSSYTIVGKSAVPSDVGNLQLAAIGGMAYLTYTASSELDVQIGGYLRVRYTSLTSGATWGAAVDIGSAISGMSSSAMLPLMNGTYLAKWVDSSGNESANATSVSTTIPSVATDNVVATITENPAWAGTNSGTLYDAAIGGIKLDSSVMIDSITDLIDTWGNVDSQGGVNSTGTYNSPTTLDLGAVMTSSLVASIQSISFDANDFVDMRTYIDSWTDVDGNVTDTFVELYVRTTQDNPAGSPTWSSWQKFFVGDYSARGFQFKAVLNSNTSTHNVVMTAMSITVDMPDRTENATNVVSSGATVVTYSKPFKFVKGRGITAENMATGDYYTITAETNSGFTITFFNSSNAAISRTFDYTTTGYGYA